jgi:hypothetical protein
MTVWWFAAPGLKKQRSFTFTALAVDNQVNPAW